MIESAAIAERDRHCRAETLAAVTDAEESSSPFLVDRREQKQVEALFRRHSREVFRRARAILGDGDAAEDATQEVFLRAMGSREILNKLVSPLAWVYRVTTNLCLTTLRNSDRRRLILNRAWPCSSSVEPTVDAALTVRSLLRDMSEEMQEIAVYYFVDRMSQDEIAAMVGLPRRTVGYRLEQFRNNFGQFDFGHAPARPAKGWRRGRSPSPSAA